MLVITKKKLIQLPADVHMGRQQVVAQVRVTQFRETWTGFSVAGEHLAQP